MVSIRATWIRYTKYFLAISLSSRKRSCFAFDLVYAPVKGAYVMSRVDPVHDQMSAVPIAFDQ